MTKDSCLEALLLSYQKYYDIFRNPAEKPFCATAEFHSQGEYYFLTKAAKIAEMDSSEYVYFSLEENLSARKLRELSDAAWNSGLSKVKPFYGHRSTDITLIVIADSVEKDAAREAGKIRHYKSYMFSLFGWSNFRLAVFGVQNNEVASNWHGREVKKLFAKTGLMS
ncbi:hypothetical protein [Treponema sp.]|uniref:hypothetical protein n=1 Tax=Treponema sp. TaxID=166 RepID=UPI003F05E21F